LVITEPVTITNALTNGTPAAATQINTGDPNTKALILKGTSSIPTNKAPNAVATLSAWWKVDALTGLTNGQGIDSFPDSSGNSHTLTQGTGSKQPIYTTNALNSLPVATFTAANVTSWTGPSFGCPTP